MRIHQALDIAIAGFLRANPKKLPSDSTIEELMKWSYKETLPKTPDEVREEIARIAKERQESLLPLNRAECDTPAIDGVD